MLTVLMFLLQEKFVLCSLTLSACTQLFFSLITRDEQIRVILAVHKKGNHLFLSIVYYSEGEMLL